MFAYFANFANFVSYLQVFIGNLDPNITEEELRQIFLQFGEISNVKIPAARGCGFVQFSLRSDLAHCCMDCFSHSSLWITAFSVSIFICRASAEEAIQRMQGAMIGQQVVRLSWGRSPTAKQVSPCLNFFWLIIISL